MTIAIECVVTWIMWYRSAFLTVFLIKSSTKSFIPLSLSAEEKEEEGWDFVFILVGSSRMMAPLPLNELRSFILESLLLALTAGL